MARKTIKQRIALDGGKEMEAQLKQLGAAGENAFDRISKAAAQADFAKLGQSLSAFSGSLQTMGKRLALAFAGVTTATTAAAAGLANIAKSGAEAADAAGKAAQAAGLQIDAYGRLAFAAEQNDVAADAFGAAMSRLNKALGEVQDGTKGAKDKFTALGVSVTDSHGKLKPTETIVQDLAEAFSKMPDGVKKSAAAIEIFGKSGASLIPFLNSGRDGLIDVGKTAERLGIVFTDAQKEIGDAMGDTLDEVAKATTGLKNQVGLLFAPTITAAAERLRDVLIANRDAILGFARSLADTALPIVQDFISALAGDDKAVKNIWILQWRDAVVDFGKSAKSAITDIFVPAMQGFKKVLDTAADGIRLFTGINIDGTMLAIAVAVGQASGAFRVLYAAIVLAKDALILLMRNPILAAATAVAAGIALWATRTDSATAAMERHKGVVDDVDEAYRRVGLKIANMAKDEKNQRLIDLREDLKTVDKELPQALDKLKSDLAQWLNSLPHAADPMMAIVKSFVDGGRSLESFTSAIREMGAANPELGKLAQQILAATKTSEGLSAAGVEVRDKIALLTGQMSDAAFIAKYFGGQVAATAADTEKAGTAAADTQKKVEALGKTITVHSSDGGKPVQQTFDLVDGVAKAADASKQSLDGVSESAAKTGESVAKVKDDISNLIIHVPDELKGQPTVADAMTQGLSDVPAAAKAAADGVIAEVSRVPQAVSGALSGGVQQGQGDPGAGGGGSQQQAQPAGSIADTLAKPFEEARDRIATALTAVPTAVTTALQTVQTAVAEGGAALGDALVTPFENMASRIAEILERMTTAVQAQFDAMLASVNSAVSQLQSAVASLESLATRAAAAAARARSATANAGGDGLATGGLVGRFAGGGRVSGPGSGTSDSILARLSNGEFVIRKAAVDKYGSEFLAVLNSARLSGAQLLSRLRQGFANGGPVLSGIATSLTTGMSMPSLVPAFADGGAVASAGGRPINLTIEGQTYEMIAPDDVADRLAKHQGRQGLRKAGKKPSWR
ncbi:hypothetical protein EOS93_10125 [Rhizobium sp. RMa-01]|uniref:phage tail tape measure protein n=1 Tax=unclassified Rhizobium TaxID=2613769 RepID=UPI0008D9BC72|nr:MULTISPECIES: phage tail tape measure protein [unclassified Rhizobium]OHV26230.1 hypothetical protein BBJ66_05800 [Rhizobium sp. RSm-3]RVU11156.1 hypothetical protein EOS93_10125 [Rhizobium sp. RMa-01]